MPITPVHSLPYPVASDPADIPVDLQELAVALDAKALTRPALVAALPSSPVDGQEIYYLADATLGRVWHLRYRSAAPAPYRWEFLGGSALSATDDTSCNRADNVFSNPNAGNSGPNLGIPLAGDYVVEIWLGRISSNVAGGQASVTYEGAGIVAPAFGTFLGRELGARMDASSNNQYFASSLIRDDRFAVGSVGLKYSSGGSSQVSTWYNRRFSVRPIRVG